MENEFARVMSERSDKQLIKILTVERYKYTALAIEAAEAELTKRQLPYDYVAETVKYEEEKIIDEFVVDFDVVAPNIRMYNFLIDIILFGIVTGLLEELILLLLPKENIIIWLIVYLSTFLFYYGFMEFKFQKTLAKFITKTKVVTYNGYKPNKDIILKRTFSRLIPIDPISYFVSSVGIHDRISQTRVIKDNPNSVIEDNFEF
ncbi:RDD family protein [Aestuariibaculum lutulentum]|uniref:RDD family protein n=1 Tax=Aestuariibaculum lutulentum TaxID=2920935 RepID=A0ABS9RGF9_9FLAO|nr:RDD family protein [Aestuariibaculum lutulentum]MCH4551992.1 RDD family protein [Aestuariibaculum lutulentum]